MAERLTITGIWRNDRTSGAGKPYVSVSMKVREHGDRYLSGFGSEWNSQWKVGDTVEVVIRKKAGVDKKTNQPVEYLNFEKPNPLDDLTQVVMKALVRIGALEKEVAALKGPGVPARVPLATVQLDDEAGDVDEVNAALAAAGLGEPDDQS